MTTVASWGIKLTPGKATKFDAFPDEEEGNVVLRISNAALGETLADQNGRSVVKITKQKGFLDNFDDEDDDEADDDAPALEEYILCALTPGKIEQVTLNIEFGSELVQFEVIGKNEVHLLGNWIDTSPDEPPSFGDSDEDSDEDDEGAFRLEDVSSDVQMDPNELDLDDDDEDTDGSRFEELAGAAANGKKRTADAMEEDAAVSLDGLSKKQKKKLAKKLKNADGEAVATSAVSAVSVTSVDASPDAKKKEKKEKKEKKDDGAAPSSKGATQTLPSGLVINDAKKGSGKAAKKGNQLSMRYIGKLENGKIFDKNTSGAPFRFRLGQGEVIKGWDQGLVGMQVGGERVLTIPAALAYGAKGAKPDIPPHATLKFEVKLLEIK